MPKNTGRNRYQTYRDELHPHPDKALAAEGHTIVVSVPDKVVKDPPVGRRFNVVEAKEAAEPSKEPYSLGGPATHEVVLNESAVAGDSLG